MLQTKSSTYAFCVDKGNNLCHLHWGAKVIETFDLPTIRQLSQRFSIKIVEGDDTQEYRGYGGHSTVEPSLKVRFSDGTRDLFLKYRYHIIDGSELYIILSDTKYPIEVTLKYIVHEEYDIIQRSSSIKNTGIEDIMLEQVFSATWILPYRNDYRLTYFPGAYCKEFQLKQEKISNGKRVIESRTGLSGPAAIPFYMIDDGTATEQNGGIYFGSVVWSGNWKMVFERDPADRIFITGGINDFDFEWCLCANECLETPVFLSGYIEGGFGNTSRNLHDYERNVIMHPMEKDRLLPIIYNTAGSFRNNINEEMIMREIDNAHDIGIELFVVEGGWTGRGDIFSTENKGNPHRYGMGTWHINKTRFPNGLKPIGDKLHEKGMKFGLWIEPEAVHPENELVKLHPEWMVKYDNREAFIINSAYVLNFANDDACEYMTEKLISLIGENGIDYIKNDYNRILPHLGWQRAEIKHQKEAWVRYVRNVTKCYSTLKKEFPDLIFENSAGGGRRTDLGMLAFAGRMHRSDNQDPLDSLRLHEGFSYFLVPRLAGGACFISDIYSRWTNDRSTTMQYQAHVAMLSSMSVSMNLGKISEEQKDELRNYIKTAKEIRHITQHGDFYRIVSPREKNYAVFEYVSKDQKEAVAFLLGQNMQFMEVPERLKLQGLQPDTRYRVEGSGRFKMNYLLDTLYYPDEITNVKEYGIFTGRGLMNAGLPVYIRGDMKSELIRIEAVS